MTNDEIKERIIILSLEHKDLDDAILLLEQQPYVDELQIQRMKKRKLYLKDQVSILESKLIPDIEA